MVSLLCNRNPDQDMASPLADVFARLGGNKAKEINRRFLRLLFVLSPLAIIRGESSHVTSSVLSDKDLDAFQGCFPTSSLSAMFCFHGKKFMTEVEFEVRIYTTLWKKNIISIRSCQGQSSAKAF